MDINTVFTAKMGARNLLGQPGVVGLGVGYKWDHGVQTDKLSVVVLVEKKKPVASLLDGELIPQRIKTVQTDVQEVGVIRALQSRKSRWRPAPGGVSIGHYKITAGTFGAVVTEEGTSIHLILSNNHVLANSNNATIGDPIYQPGPADGGKPADTIGSLYNFIPIDFGEEDGADCPFADYYTRFGNWFAGLVGSVHRLKSKRINPQAVNYVDAALAIPNNQDDIENRIIDAPAISGWEDPVLGMAIAKSGRTTEYTVGNITMVHATVQVDYGAGQIATLEDQIISGYMSAGGDSGSLMYNYETNKAVGLLFAGSDRVTIYNPIKRVLDALHVMI